ncbi:long-chain fatty acid--CoA ligase [Rhizobacter sp. Root404]|uniref:AMP-dependent synthetase/ligase n=1 Tax=Rhizobacter sp. Root404 TaxID=1736528 RepID=UPI000AA09AA7|nr:AMP-binding protein [Rhizobacter sp. Root404]
MSARDASSLSSDGPRTVPQWLAHNARERARLVGHRYKCRGIWREFNWAQIHDRTVGIAFGLLALGAKAGDTVMLIGENRPEIFWAEWAAMAIGAKTVTLYPDASEQELRYIATDSQAVCIFADDQEQVDKALPVAAGLDGLAHVVYWEPGGMQAYRDPALRSLEQMIESGAALRLAEPGRVDACIAAGQADDIALLAYTSGTTGNPKGVITTHRALLGCAEQFQKALQVEPHGEYLSYVPLSWITEQWVGVVMGMMLPLRVNFAERPDQVQEAIRELAVDVLFLGPRQWESLAAGVHTRMIDAGPVRQAMVKWGLGIGRAVHVARIEGREPPRWPRLLLPLAEMLVLGPLRDQLGLKRVRIAMTGGAATAPDVVRLFAAMGVRMRNIYGCSEYGLVSAHVGDSYDPESVGTPCVDATRMAGPLEYRITDEGELQLRAGLGFAGYWNRPDKTAEKFDGEWFRTGDAVSRTPAGALVYYDRLEHMSALTTGERYPKQYIEIRLRFSPYIKEVLVIGDARHGFVTALVNIDDVVFARWAEQRNLGFTTFTDLSQKPEVLTQIALEIAQVNARLPGNAKVRRFANLPKPLDADEGELTRTRKLKREFIEERYRALVDGLYTGLSTVDVAIPVKYQDGRSGVLAASVRIGDVDAEALEMQP